MLPNSLIRAKEHPKLGFLSAENLERYVFIFKCNTNALWFFVANTTPTARKTRSGSGLPMWHVLRNECSGMR